MISPETVKYYEAQGWKHEQARSNGLPIEARGILDRAAVDIQTRTASENRGEARAAIRRGAREYREQLKARIG